MEGLVLNYLIPCFPVYIQWFVCVWLHAYASLHKFLCYCFTKENFIILTQCGRDWLFERFLWNLPLNKIIRSINHSISIWIREGKFKDPSYATRPCLDGRHGSYHWYKMRFSLWDFKCSYFHWNWKEELSLSITSFPLKQTSRKNLSISSSLMVNYIILRHYRLFHGTPL